MLLIVNTDTVGSEPKCLLAFSENLQTTDSQVHTLALSVWFPGASFDQGDESVSRQADLCFQFQFQFPVPVLVSSSSSCFSFQIQFQFPVLFPDAVPVSVRVSSFRSRSHIINFPASVPFPVSSFRFELHFPVLVSSSSF